MGICSVDGCPSQIFKMQLCRRHYSHLHKYGKVIGNPSRTRLSLQEYNFRESLCEIVLVDNLGEESARAIIDQEDFERICDNKWSLDKRGYVYCHSLRKRIHQLILGGSDRRRQIDHIDGNRLNNRKSNLRFCSNVDNCRNRTKQRNNTSGYKGVGKGKTPGTWDASIMTSEGKNLYLGRFRSTIQAAIAYDDAARNLHGEFARTNFDERLIGYDKS